MGVYNEWGRGGYGRFVFWCMWCMTSRFARWENQRKDMKKRGLQRWTGILRGIYRRDEVIIIYIYIYPASFYYSYSIVIPL